MLPRSIPFTGRSRALRPTPRCSPQQQPLPRLLTPPPLPISPVLTPQCTSSSSSTATSSSSSIPPFQPSPSTALLQQWVLDAGGFVHPDLMVVDQAPCGGGRGIVCCRDLSEEEVTGMPMLLVPEDLLLTTEVARHGFSSHYEPKGAPPLHELDQATQLAIMLAHERLDGEDSFYHPYISSLPPQPPCAWALPPHLLQQQLDALAPHLDPGTRTAWAAEVQRYRQAMERHAQGAEERYWQYFPLTASDFFWSMGQVLSRSFSSHPSLALMPLLDLCNHRSGADHPEAIALGGDEADRSYCVSSISGEGKWEVLGAGQELFIRYFDSGGGGGLGGRASSSSGSSSSSSQGSSGSGSGSTSGSRAGPPPLPVVSPGAGAAGTQGQAQSTDALLCFLSHGHVFPELWTP